MLSSHPRLGLPCCRFPSSLQPITLSVYTDHPRHSCTCPTAITLHNLMTVRIFAEKYTSWWLQLYTFLQFPLTCSSLDPNIFPAPYFRTPSNFVLLKVGDKVSDTEGPLPCSHQPATDRCAVPDESIPHPPMLLFNPLNAELNPICHLLALLGAHHIIHVSRIRVKIYFNIILQFSPLSFKWSLYFRLFHHK